MCSRKTSIHALTHNCSLQLECRTSTSHPPAPTSPPPSASLCIACFAFSSMRERESSTRAPCFSHGIIRGERGSRYVLCHTDAWLCFITGSNREKVTEAG